MRSRFCKFPGRSACSHFDEASGIEVAIERQRFPDRVLALTASPRPAPGLHFSGLIDVGDLHMGERLQPIQKATHRGMPRTAAEQRPGFASRPYSDAGRTISAQWEMSRDGSRWAKDFDLVYRKSLSAATLLEQRVLRFLENTQ